MTLEKIVYVRPAFDCLMIQPCVHGSDRCGTVPYASHGRHNAELHLTLRGATAELTLVINTGWYLSETPQYVRVSSEARGSRVEFHSAVPRYEGQELQQTKCDLWPAGCYGDAGYTMAEEPADLLMRKGSDAAWEWLETTYKESFPGAATS